MKLQRIKTYLASAALVFAAVTLTGCATTMDRVAHDHGNMKASPHGKEKEASAMPMEEKPSKDVKATGRKKREKMTAEERRKLVEFYKELNAAY